MYRYSVYNNFIFTVFPLQDITPYIHGKLNTSGLIDLIEIKGCQWYACPYVAIFNPC